MSTSLLAKIVALVLGGMYIDSKLYLSRDLNTLLRARRFMNEVMKGFAPLRTVKNASLYSGLAERVKQKPDEDGFVFVDSSKMNSGCDMYIRKWTFAEIDQVVGKLADWLLELGLKEGDVLGVYAPNSPQLYFIFWACAKIGITAGLLNSSQTGATLAHSIRISTARVVIATPEQIRAIQGVHKEAFADEDRIFYHVLAVRGLDDQVENEKSAVDQASWTWLDDLPATGRSDEAYKRGTVTITSVQCLIYTSSTTGLPKAVSIPVRSAWSSFFAGTHREDFLPGDRWYCALPLYHSSALLIGMLQSIGAGIPFILSSKFSASKQFQECSLTGATSFQYIGETCRYLLNTPPSEWDRKHRLRFVWGNGMRADIWEKFRERFGIPIINEFYGSTEGSIYLVQRNFGPDGAGCFFHRGPLIRLANPVLKIVKHDPINETLYRDPKTGFCIEVAKNEPGEILAKIMPDVLEPRAYFRNAEAHNKKIYRDVFEKGDMWYRQGDIIRMRDDGWLEFVDRVGDTFRWKGENVSTTEVAAIVGSHPAVKDNTVFGVQLSKYDGQAGMAAIVLDEAVHHKRHEILREMPRYFVKKGMPTYMIPRFVRLMDAITSTATYKHQKAVLKKESISVFEKDPIYMLRVNGSEENGDVEYVPLGSLEHQLVQEGRAKL